MPESIGCSYVITNKMYNLFYGLIGEMTIYFGYVENFL